MYAARFLLVLLLSLVSVWPLAAEAFEVPDGARLVIPKLEVEADIQGVELGAYTWDVSQLGDNAGFLDGLEWFDAERNTVLVGHVDHGTDVPGVFYALDTLEPDDEILVLDGQRERHYRVAEVFTVDDSDLSVLYPGESSMLTLITCDDDTYDPEHGHYTDRIVVTAYPTD